MNLRKFRRATAKKQILDSMAKGSNKHCPDHPTTDLEYDKPRKRKLLEIENLNVGETDHMIKDIEDNNVNFKNNLKCQSPPTKVQKVTDNNVNVETRSEQNKREVETEEKVLAKQEDSCMKDKIRTITESSESNSMTLQQFTDIVLASEGVCTPRKGQISENTPPATPSTPQRKDSLQSSCGGDDEASNSIPTNYSSVIERKVSTESANNVVDYDTRNMVSSAPTNSPNNVSCNVKLEQIDNGYGSNNNILNSKAHNAMVANIMNNKDLIVEVKPMCVKPVVLSPRHPYGHNNNFNVNNIKECRNGEVCNNNNPWHSNSGQHPLSGNRRYYSSSRPRVQRYDSDNSSCSGDITASKLSPLPKGRPPSVPKMVEEWLKKIQPPQFEDDEDNHDNGNYDTTISDNSIGHMPTSQLVPRKHQLVLRDPQEMKTAATNFQSDCNPNTVLNLSTKDNKMTPNIKEHHVQKSLNHTKTQLCDSNSLKMSKPAQVYLRPIPTHQMTNGLKQNKTLSPLPTPHLPSVCKPQISALHDHRLKTRHRDYEQIVILDRHTRKEQYPAEMNGRHCNPVEGPRSNKNNPNKNPYHKGQNSLPTNVHNGRASVNNNTRFADKSHHQLLSSPNLEITRITSGPKQPHTDIQEAFPTDRITRKVDNFNLPTLAIPSVKHLARTFPFEASNPHKEGIKVKAVRDIHLAHTKDLHGN